jgi:hypothetical protein
VRERERERERKKKREREAQREKCGTLGKNKENYKTKLLLE